MRIHYMKLLVFTLLFLVTVVAGSDTYYVDYSSGKDTNNGAATSSPFQHSPGDDAATGTAAATVLQPGDTLVFRGGVVYNGRIDADVSGTLTSAISYESGHLTRHNWGSSRAIIDGTGITLDYSVSSTHRGVISLQSASNIRVEGLEIISTPVYVSAVGYGGGISWVGSSGGNVEIIDVYIHGGSENGIAIVGAWSGTQIPTGFVIRNSIIENNGWHGIIVQNGTRSITIEGNTIHDNGWAQEGNGIFTGSSTSLVPEDIVIAHNTIYDHTVKGHMNVSGHGLLIEGNFCYSTKVQGFGIQIAAEFFGSEVTTRDVVIRNNVVDVDSRYEGSIRIQHPVAASGRITNVSIHNNTIIQRGQYYAIWLRPGVSTQPDAISNVHIYNNLVIAQVGMKQPIYAHNSQVTAGFIADHNHYVYGSNSVPFKWEGNNLTLSQWKALGFDTFSHTQNVDPMVSSTYEPLDGSPLIDNGMPLLDITVDLLGTERPQGIEWDIGAYESPEDGSSSQGAVQAPVRLRIQEN